MLTYQAVYRYQGGMFFGEVPDFPEANALGARLADTRENLLSALRQAAQRRLRQGELLPLPNDSADVGDAYAVERLIITPYPGEYQVMVSLEQS